MFAFKNAVLIDGKGGRPINNAAIIIEGRYIRGAAADLKGKTVIPALSDAHTHLSGSSDLRRPAMSGRAESCDFAEMRENCLALYVLTVRSCGHFLAETMKFRDEVRSGAIANSPRVIAGSEMYQARGGHPCYTVYQANPDIERDACLIIDDKSDIEAMPETSAGLGADFIKVFYAHLNKMDYPNAVPRISKNALKRIIAAAHKNGLKAAVHVDCPRELSDAAECGADSIEHIIGVGETDTEVTEELVTLVRDTGSVIVPTMVSILRFDPIGEAMPVWEPLKTAVKKFYDGGVRIGVGCDSGIPFVKFGESVHSELEYLVEAGISPIDALTMAASGNARLFGMENEIGSIESGKLADTLVLGGDPISDIRNTRDIRMVVKEGRIISERLL